MDCICLKRKHKKRRDLKKFRPISPHVSPVHSQPSTLGHVPEPRLPKVNSTGLWFGAPSVYATGPAPAYYYGRPYGKQRVDYPQHIQRAASETRLPQARPFAPYRQVFTSHNNVYMIPAAHGQRIYHSQQLAPVYEMPPTAGMEIYDVYQFAGGNSRSKLLETKHSQNYHNSEFRLGNRVERSQSDAQDRASSRRHEGRRTNSKDRAPVHDGPKRPSSKDRQSFASSQRSSRSGESHRANGGSRRGESHTNRGFSPDSRTSLDRVPETNQQHKVTKMNGNIPAPNPALPTTAPTPSPTLPNGKAGVVSATVPATSTGEITSATDSMKLLAKNKTDDQKTIVQPGMVSVMVGKDGEKDINYKHYVYQGDIYAVPDKSSSQIISGNLQDDDNPILSRMKEMVIEKNRSSVPNSPRSDPTDPTALVSSSGEPVIYEEIKTSKVTRTEVETTTADEDALAGLDLPDPDELAKLKDEPVRHNLAEPVRKNVAEPVRKNVAEPERHNVAEPVIHNVVEPSHSVTTTTMETSQYEQETGETTTKTQTEVTTHTQLSPRASWDGEASPEDLSNAGKRITESAFTFLDKYLSDDEGTDTHIESPPLSPTGQKAQTVGD